VTVSGHDRTDPRAHFDPENDLEEAMLVALVEPDAMPAFLDALADAVLLLPTDVPATPGRGRVLRFPVIRLGDREGVAAYTSMTRLAAARPEGTPLVRMRGREVAAAWDHDLPLLVNAAAELGLALEPDAVRDLTRRE
jgi:SseB protein N-terminal domain